MLNEVGCLRVDLQQVRDDRDRQKSQVQALTEELANYHEYMGKSSADMDSLTIKSNELEVSFLNIFIFAPHYIIGL